MGKSRTRTRTRTRTRRNNKMQKLMNSIRHFSPIKLLNKTVKTTKNLMKTGSKMTGKYVRTTRKFLKKADSVLARI